MNIVSWARTACLSIAACLPALLSLPAQAEITIDRTRAVYPAQEREITVRLKNESATPRLMQTWIDNGEIGETPEQIDVPFTVTPPIARMETGRSQALRIVHSKTEGKALPADKESVYWLNVLGIRPTMVPADEKNNLQFAFRTRIKLFFRPAGLPGYAEEAPAALQWKLVADSAERVLEIRNPSAYHVSFSSITLMVGGKEISIENPPMLVPGGTERFVLKTMSMAANAKSEVRFKIIDDYGNVESHTAPL
jgi:chaperone protein EcpD